MMEMFKILRYFFTPVELNLTAAAVPYLLAASTAVSAYGAVASGQAQSAAAKAQAAQAEADARTQTIERKRALIQTLAQQNVGAAAQGRTIESISALQQEDIRRASYDETLIAGGAASQVNAYNAAASSASSSGLLSAGTTLLSGAYDYAKTLK